MSKKKEDKTPRWNRSVKIPDFQEEKIEKLIGILGLSAYRSVSDFVVKAVENEIRIATFKSGLSDMGRYHFDLLYLGKLQEAYEKAYDFDAGNPGSRIYEAKKESKESWDKAMAKIEKK